MSDVLDLKHRARSGDRDALQQLRAGGHFARPAAAKSGYAVSHAQKRLWILDRMGAAGGVYNIPGAVSLDGPLRIDALRGALASVVQRHESLRTTFREVDGEPRQFVGDTMPELRVIDAESDDAARAILREDAAAPFDLQRGPLLRALALRLSAKRWIVSVNLHHIIADEWSLRVLLRDLAAYYNAAVTGDEIPLPPLRAQARDFAARQAMSLRHVEAAVHRAYWSGKLGGEIPLLDLPLDFARPSELTHHGASVGLLFDDDLSRALRRLARDAHATMFQTLTALTKVLLHRTSGQEDIIIGAPIAGRDEPELEDQIGSYVNTLVLRDTVSPHEGFLSLLERVKQTAEEAYEHAAMPFDLLVNELHAARDLARSPLFDVAVIVEHRDTTQPELHALRAAELPFGFATAKFDLSIYYTDTGGALRAALNYNRDLFRERTIERMGGHLAQLAQEIVRDPHAPVGALEMITATERATVARWTDTAASYPAGSTIADLFEEQAARTPERPAVTAAGRTLTYRELDARANQIAHTLVARHGASPRERIPILLTPSEGTVAALLGVLKAGRAYVPLDPSYPPERLRLLLGDCGGRVLLTEEATRELAHQIAPPGVAVADIRDLDDAGKPPPRASLPDDPAYVIYTSGSTGAPKGCCVTNRNVVRLMKNDHFPFDFHERDVWIVAHSFAFDFSVWETWGALLYGGLLVVPERDEVRDPQRFRRLIRRAGVTVLNQTPAAFYNLIAAEESAEEHNLDAHLRCVIFGGDRLDPTRLRPWVERYPLDRVALVNMFGITETTVHITHGPLTPDDVFGAAGHSRVGRPLPETTVYVFNPSRKLQPVGVAGELYVGGSGVCSGYLGRPELTAERFVANPYKPAERLYRSGDLGRWADDGTLEHLGRNDDQVQVRGFRIELREIERALRASPGVAQAVVVARDSADGVQELAAYVVADGPFDAAALRERLRASLPEQMLPAFIVPIDTVPLTSNNKIDLRALPPPDGTAARGAEPFVAPRDDLERSLAAAWQGVLDSPSISVFDNYFNLGGDSMKVIRLINAVAEECDTRLEVKDVFRHPTIAALAAHIRGVPSGGGVPETLREAYTQLDALRDSIALDADWEDVYPMSDIELGMIFHNSADAGRATYHDQFVYEIEDDDFNLARLQRALDLLVRKHPMLRTSFHLDGFAEPVQIVHARREVDVELHDLAHLTEVAQYAALRAMLEDDRAAPFDVTQPGLWRMRAVRLSARRYALVWIIHHAIFDGWSNASFIAELTNVCERLRREPRFAPEPLRASYRDLVADQIRWSASPEARDFWRSDLADCERMPLPFGRTAADGRGARRRIVTPVGAAIAAGLGTFARGENVAVRDVFIAAFAVLMELVTGSDALLFGLVSHNRPLLPDADAVLGCFLNTIPFRCALPFPRTQRDLARAVRRRLDEIRPHEKLPLRRIAGAGNPLFDVIFNFLDFHVLDTLEEETRRSGRTLMIYESTNTALDISVSGTFGDFSIAIYYLDDLFTTDEIDRLAGYYLRILERFAVAPNERLTNDALLGEDERRVLASVNDTFRDYPRDASVAALFDEQARAGGVRCAIAEGDVRLTYDDLRIAARGAAAALHRAHGVQPEERIGVLTARSHQAAVAMLSILTAGGAYVPIEPEWPAERIRFVLADSGCRIVLADAAHLSLAASFDGVTALDIATLAREPESALPPAAGGASLAYVNYTSGSTGRPKASLIEQRSLIRLVRDTNYVAVQPGDRILQAGSLAFDACTFEIWGALLNGAAVVFAQKATLLDPERLARQIRDDGITLLFLTTSLFNQLADADPAMFASLRVLMTGGEKGSARHFRAVRRACPALDLLHVYGPTENTTFSTFHRVTGIDGDDVPIGLPIANSTAHVVDANLQPLPAGVPGEICTGGDGVARGYLGDAALTAARFVADPFRAGGRMYRTGDLGRRRADGAIVFVARRDGQVKIRGFRVEPGEVEHHLLAHPAVRQAAVAARPTPAGTKELIAAYVAEGALEPAELGAFLGGRLPVHMIPAELVRVDSLPVTSIGKIDRAALATLAAARDEGEPLASPRDEREALLQRVWAEVLGRKTVGVHDSYFQLGGDSIRMIQVNARLAQAGWRMDVRDLFLHPAIAALAPRLTRATLPRKAAPGAVPLAPAQRWFFDAHHGPLHHFNMPVLLRAAERIDATALRAALQTIWETHDLLRAVFRRADDPARVEQFVRGITPVSLDVIDCRGTTTRVPEHAEALQGSLDLERGPLMKAALYRLDDEDRLLIVVHHLVVDAVSWRILLGDLEEAYAGRALAAGGSFRDWVEQLEPDESTGDDDDAFDFPMPAVNRYGDCASIEVELPADERASEDVFLTALARALEQWLVVRAARVLLEGHGRFAGGGHVDVSRTVGWFTSMTPLRLELRGDGSVTQRAAGALPRLSFNYLGRFDSARAGMFTLLPEVAGRSIGPDLPRHTVLDLVGASFDGRLRFAATYNRHLHERGIIERFLRDFRAQLVEMRR
jgi:amino acid adenylation domain-containing protein